jgi:hypothetical protein
MIEDTIYIPQVRGHNRMNVDCDTAGYGPAQPPRNVARSSQHMILWTIQNLSA